MHSLKDKIAVIAQLQQDILLLEGFKPPANGIGVDVGLEPIKDAFPNAVFPTAAVHEFLSTSIEQGAATAGFVGGILGKLMQQEGVCIWISSTQMLFPPALKTFGIAPHRIIFIKLNRERDILWAMEEALKCEKLAAVVAELQEINLTASRRLQLAVEKSRVTGFILRHQPRSLGNTSCVSRWRITPISSSLDDDMPGVGFPRWKVELLKIRNGRPGTWQMEWSAKQFHIISERRAAPLQELLLKRG